MLDKNVEVLIQGEGAKAELAKELSKIRVEESLNITDLPERITEQNPSSSLVNLGDSRTKVESLDYLDECVDTSDQG